MGGLSHDGKCNNAVLSPIVPSGAEWVMDTPILTTFKPRSPNHDNCGVAAGGGG